jgi:DNA-binding XRE family transcriptional regulator
VPLAETQVLGAKLARLRHARKVRQSDAAARAGLARSTAVLIEKGDPSCTLGQIFRYLAAFAPGLSLPALLLESDPSLAALAQAEVTQRVRPCQHLNCRRWTSDVALHVLCTHEPDQGLRTHERKVVASSFIYGNRDLIHPHESKGQSRD